MLTIDAIFALLTATVFNPALCWLPLIFRSLLQFAIDALDLGVPNLYQAAASSDTDALGRFLLNVFITVQVKILPWSRAWQWYLAVCIVVAVCWDIVAIDSYLARRRNGHAAFVPDPQQDAVVVTGGGLKRGLGRAVAKWFQSRKYHVIVLDIQWEEDKEEEVADLPKIQFVRCDVSDYDEVSKLYKPAGLEAMLPEGVLPSILVNNAGVAHNKQLVDLDPEAIKRTLSVNLLAPFWTCKSLLRNVLRASSPEKPPRYHRGASIVNVASVLGAVGTSELTAYCASKGGLRLFHDALLHEVGEPYFSASADAAPVNMLLVTPGQLDTSMFESATTPSARLMPVVSAQELAHQIGAAVLTGQTGTLAVPLFTRFWWAAGALPGFVVEGLRKVMRLDEQMGNFGKPLS